MKVRRSSALKTDDPGANRGAHRGAHQGAHRGVHQGNNRSGDSLRIATYNIHKGVVREFFGLQRIARIHELRARLHELDADSSESLMKYLDKIEKLDVMLSPNPTVQKSS